MTKPGLTHTTRTPRSAVGVAQTLEEGGEAGFGGAVEVVAAARAISGDGAEDANGPAAPRREPLGGHLAEHGGAGEVDVQQPLEPDGIGGQILLVAEQPAGHDQRVEASEPAVGGVERVGEAGGQREVERGLPDGAGGPSDLEVAGRGLEVGGVAPEEPQCGPALGEQAGQGPAHPPRGPDEDSLHDGSPNRRTDCAERNRRVGSQRSRTAFHSPRRGIMRAKSSARVTASLAR